jgi:thiamine-phosphate pyrophosphorylase
LTLYLVADQAIVAGHTLSEVVTAAVAGGVTMVQLRDKTSATEGFLKQARYLSEILHPRSIPLIINDRIDIALAIGAEGVHLGSDDMPTAEARRLLGPNSIIGVSVGTVAELARVDTRSVSYVSIGPIYNTTSKINAGNPLGLEGFINLLLKIELPIVAIGGINIANASQLIKAGACGVAVISAICADSNPRRATEKLLSVILAARESPVVMY